MFLYYKIYQVYVTAYEMYFPDHEKIIVIYSRLAMRNS